MASLNPDIRSANEVVVPSNLRDMTGWTTAIAAGDVLLFDVVSAATVTRVELTLTIEEA